MQSIVKAAAPTARRNLLRRPLRPSPFGSSCYSLYFSTNEATKPKEQTPPVAEFVYPKAKEMFEKITAQLSTEEEARTLQRCLYEMLGRPLRENEFYYSGFGKGKGKKAGGGAGGAAEEEVVEEKKTAFDLKLVGFDAKSKIKVIKEVRSLAGLGLKQAKEMVESAPIVFLKGIKTEEAEAAKAKLVELGAEIELV